MNLTSSGPNDATDQRRQEDFIGESVVGMAVGGAKNSSFSELICPKHRLGLAGLFAFGRGEDFGIWPDLLDDIQLIHRGLVIGGYCFGNWVVLLDDFDGISTLMFVFS